MVAQAGVSMPLVPESGLVVQTLIKELRPACLRPRRRRELYHVRAVRRLRIITAVFGVLGRRSLVRDRVTT